MISKVPLKEEDINNLIYRLQGEFDACDERGFNFSASQIEWEIKKWERVLERIKKNKSK